MAKKTLKTLGLSKGFHPERSRRVKKGLLITLEGPEGCGKTTQAKLLYDHLSRSFNCLLTREPGGTELGERVRRILLDQYGIAISDLAELFLFEACRAQVVSEIIGPALSKKMIVICDRFYDATTAYQGFAGGIAVDKIKKLNMVATAGIEPDITMLLDLDSPTGLRRAALKGVDRMEKKDADYHKKVRQGYLSIAMMEPRRVKVIKVKDSIAQTQALVRMEVEHVIRRYKRTGLRDRVPEKRHP